MAFFGNQGNKMYPGHDLNEKVEENEEEGTYGNRDLDADFSDKDVDMKMEDQCQSDEEPPGAAGQRSDASGGNSIGRPGKRTGPTGTWGSSFWKDCQPMWKSKDEDDNGKEGEEEGGGEQSQRGQADVPADEMLSDEYYEQEGEEPSSSLHNRGFSRPSTSGSRFPLKLVPGSKKTTKAIKAMKYGEFDDDYEESEEEEEGDDPDDADFEPEFDGASKGPKNKVSL